MSPKRCKQKGLVPKLPQEMQVRVLEMLDLPSIARIRAVSKGCLQASKLIRKLHVEDFCVFSSTLAGRLQVLPSLASPNWKFFSSDSTKTVGKLCASGGGLLCFSAQCGTFSILDIIDSSVFEIPSVPGHNTSDLCYIGLVASDRKFEALVCLGREHIVHRDELDFDAIEWDKDYSKLCMHVCHVYNGTAWDTSLLQLQRNEMLVCSDQGISDTSATLHGSSLYFNICIKNRAKEVTFGLRVYDFNKKEITKMPFWGNGFGLLHAIQGGDILDETHRVTPKPVVVDGQLFLVGLDSSSDIIKENGRMVGRYSFKLLKFDYRDQAWKNLQHKEMEYVFYDDNIFPGLEVTASGTKICINIFFRIYCFGRTELLVYDTVKDLWYDDIAHVPYEMVGRLM